MPTPSPAISLTSTPVWNARPSPVCTMTRTSGSPARVRHATSNSSRMCAFIAFSCAGRLLINQPTAPRRSRMRVSSSGYVMSAPRDLAPRCTLPRVGFPGQTEDAFDENVLVHLGRASLDGVGATAQHAAHLGRRLLRPRRGAGAEHRRREQLHALVQRALVHLADGALRAGRAPGFHLRAHPLVGPVADALLAVDPQQLLAPHGVARAPGAPGEVDDVVDAAA